MKSLARFEEKYVVNPENGCWLWAYHVDKVTGYARFRVGDGQSTINAHAFSYALHKGSVPAGLELDHKCRVRSCVNPAHLEAVTHGVNMARGCVAMRTHCNHGHEFTKENTSMHHGYRRCKTCHREQEARRRG